MNENPGDRRQRTRLPLALFAALAWGVSGALAQKPQAERNSIEEGKSSPGPAARQASKPGKPRLDHSGRKKKGKASYYGSKFTGRKMADGTPMNPRSNAAASKTLPLGTRARVTNLDNGKSTVVEIRDRGPYAGDRIIDVTPATADKLGMKEQGVAPVEVAPLQLPPAGDNAKPQTAPP